LADLNPEFGSAVVCHQTCGIGASALRRWDDRAENQQAACRYGPLCHVDDDFAEVRSRSHVLVGRVNLVEAEHFVDHWLDPFAVMARFIASNICIEPTEMPCTLARRARISPGLSSVAGPLKPPIKLILPPTRIAPKERVSVLAPPTVWPAISLPCSTQRVPRGHASTRKRRALFGGEVRRSLHDALLLQHHKFRQHTVDAAAQRGRLHIRGRFAAGPALEEAAGDLVADLNARDAGTDLHHLAGTIGQRNDVVLNRHAVGAAHNAEIAKAATLTSTWR
jgi:hypothetical protein